jgi:hypothetical protein
MRNLEPLFVTRAFKLRKKKSKRPRGKRKEGWAIIVVLDYCGPQVQLMMAPFVSTKRKED